MPFDANLVLVDGSVTWSFANINTSNYGTPTSTTRNAGGFAVIDMGGAGVPSDMRGLAVVLIMPSTVTAGDELTLIVEESTTEIFTVPHELAKFDILAATKGVILGSEAPATVIRRIVSTLRYLRVDASITAADDFGLCQVLLSPYPYKYL